jgi:hypothetical protein
MRRLAALVLTAALVASCSRGDDPTVADPPATTTTERSTTTEASTTTTAGTTTTASPLVPIEGCPAPPPLAVPDPNRPAYQASVALDPVNGVADGTMTVRFTPDVPTDVLVFRLWPNAPRTAEAGAVLSAGPAARVGMGPAVTTTQPDATTLEVALGTTLAAGRSVTVTLPWHLDVPGPASDRISRTGDTMRLGSYLPVLAWEPGVGWAREPPTAIFAEAATSPAADYELAITAPDGYDVLSTGAPGVDGVWRATAVRDVALAVGHFDVVSSTESLPAPVAVTVAVDGSIGEDPAAYHERVVAALHDFAGRWGAYPWSTFGLAITPDLGGGIEFPTMVLQGPDTIGRTTPHEVGHMWFYALVGNNQGRDPWLDEGLASYAEYVHEGVLDEMRGREIPSDAAGHTGEPMTFWAGHGSSYYRGVYLQGAVALASLGSVDQVDCALRQYVAAQAFGVAAPDDLFAALGTVFADPVTALAPYGLAP